MFGASNNIMLPGDCNSRGREILSKTVLRGKRIFGRVAALKPETGRYPGGGNWQNSLSCVLPHCANGCIAWLGLNMAKGVPWKMPKYLSSHVILLCCSPPPKLVGLSISDATTSRAPCSLPSRAALCCGASWSSGSCSWIPNLQGVIFFCTSAQRSSLFCSPGRYDGITTQSEMRWHYTVFNRPAAGERRYATFVLLDPVSGLKIPQVWRRIPQRERRTLGETRQFLKLPGWNPLIISHLWQAGESVEYGLGSKNAIISMLPHFCRFYLLGRNILTNLEAVVADWMKGTEEKVLLDPCPVLVGIPKHPRQWNKSNKCIKHTTNNFLEFV